ncbi:hypothetical protein M5689_022267 [Euphorbia peplus]|nr:hypothetical protein M5689_022267 [Euphorbia peplus]
MIKLPFSGSALLFILLVMFQTCMTADTVHRPASACGGTNISYPFTLLTDPISCGDDQYKLSCENNITVLHLVNGGKYHVQAINYDNFTIRLVDASVDKDDCSSIPSFPLTTTYGFGFQDPYTSYTYQQKPDGQDVFLFYSEPEDEREDERLPAEMITFIKCQSPVNSSVYLDTSPYIKSLLPHSYVHVGELKGYDLRDGCSLEMVSLMLPRRDSKNRNNSSFIEVHREVAFGFELSWHNVYCRRCSSAGCYRDNKDHFHCISTNQLFISVQVL